jgi:hypothetical protein
MISSCSAGHLFLYLKGLVPLNLNKRFSASLRYNSDSGTTQAAIIVIAACRAPLPHTFAADFTLTSTSTTTKCLFTLNTRLRYLKSEGPLKIKKKCPSEQWQVICCRLIPLLTHVSFRCTVPLTNNILNPQLFKGT